MPANRTRNTATAQRRQRQIEDCLFENLQHTPWQSISVADLCRQVGISRKAYYNYYRDKSDCLCSYIDRLLRESMLHTAQHVPDEADNLTTACVMLEFWKGKKSFFDVILKNDLLYLLMMRNIDYFLQEDRSIFDLLNTPELKSDEDILACYTSVQLTLVLQWYSRGFDTPTEVMARKLLRILHDPMIAHN